MKLYLVDDNNKFRGVMKTFTEGLLNHEVVGESDTGQHFLDNYTDQADVVLMDINMPEVDGLLATKLGSRKHYDIKIIAVSQYATINDIQQLISVGFKGFVSKSNLFEQLNDAIETVYAGNYYFPGADASNL